MNYALTIEGKSTGGSMKLHAHCNADFANASDRKSISGYAIMFGTCCISYRSQKQCLVALSTAEVEYIALFDCVKETIWFMELLAELGYKQDSIIVHCDSQSAISIAKNPGQYE
jgi:hypothetical protein